MGFGRSDAAEGAAAAVPCLRVSYRISAENARPHQFRRLSRFSLWNILIVHGSWREDQYETEFYSEEECKLLVRVLQRSTRALPPPLRIVHGMHVGFLRLRLLPLPLPLPSTVAPAVMEAAASAPPPPPEAAAAAAP
jgi:hypothetical protein